MEGIVIQRKVQAADLHHHHGQGKSGQKRLLAVLGEETGPGRAAGWGVRDLGDFSSPRSGPLPSPVSRPCSGLPMPGPQLSQTAHGPQKRCQGPPQPKSSVAGQGDQTDNHNPERTAQDQIKPQALRRGKRRGFSQNPLSHIPPGKQEDSHIKRGPRQRHQNPVAPGKYRQSRRAAGDLQARPFHAAEPPEIPDQHRGRLRQHGSGGVIHNYLMKGPQNPQSDPLYG